MGVLAGLAHVFYEPESFIPCVGASGAIAGVMGAYLVMFPKSSIKMLFFIRIFKIPAFIFLAFWIGQQLLSGIGALPMFQSEEGVDGGGVAYWAHIGGFVVGLLAGFTFRGEAKNHQLMAESNQIGAAWERFKGGIGSADDRRSGSKNDTRKIEKRRPKEGPRRRQT